MHYYIPSWPAIVGGVLLIGISVYRLIKRRRRLKLAAEYELKHIKTKVRIPDLYGPILGIILGLLLLISDSIFSF